MTLKSKNHPEPPVLIDTPLWREYFHREEKIVRQINALMDMGRVCTLDLIIAELVDGAGDEEELKAFLDFARIFPILREPEGAWTQAAEWVRKLQKKNRYGLRDAYITFMAKTHGVLLWTRKPSGPTFRLSRISGLKLFIEQEFPK
jgi:predicted nucleic acid-binding protein